MKIRINKPLKKYTIGDIVEIEVDRNGTPLDPYWNRRMSDSKIDNCIEKVVKEKPAKKEKEKIEKPKEEAKKEEK